MSDTEPTDRERCPTCDKPMATTEEFSDADIPSSAPLCWYGPDDCRELHIDWRARALTAEAALKLSEARNAILREALEKVRDGEAEEAGCGICMNDPDEEHDWDFPCGIAARALSQAAALGTAQAPTGEETKG